MLGEVLAQRLEKIAAEAIATAFLAASAQVAEHETAACALSHQGRSGDAGRK
jgi:hypothetical protein